MMAMAIAIIQIGLADELRGAYRKRCAFLFAQKNVNVHFGVKNAFIYAVFLRMWMYCEKNTLPLQQLAASSVVGRRS